MSVAEFACLRAAAVRVVAEKFLAGLVDILNLVDLLQGDLTVLYQDNQTGWGFCWDSQAEDLMVSV